MLVLLKELKKTTKSDIFFSTVDSIINFLVSFHKSSFIFVSTLRVLTHKKNEKNISQNRFLVSRVNRDRERERETKRNHARMDVQRR
jgi:hypothetical protein